MAKSIYGAGRTGRDYSRAPSKTSLPLLLRAANTPSPEETIEMMLSFVPEAALSK